MELTDYRTLGRTGLRVSPLCLGAMTFGWGADEAQSRQLFDHYRDQGGNFIDTADIYSGGRSEELVGQFVSEVKARDAFVIATKFTFNDQANNPNAGGNGRKNIFKALDGSLKRLKTDYIDLYIMHTWDQVTPAEEVLSTLNDLVRAGKIRHIGLSDVPAYYASRFQTLSEVRGYEPVASLQLEYSLASRSLEREHLRLALDHKIGITPWSPLAGGFLTGKYKKVDGSLVGHGRVKENENSGNPIFERFSKREQNWMILDELILISEELEKLPAQVALNWVATRPAVASTLVGATHLDQLKNNLDAIRFDLPIEMRNRLDRVSALEATELDHFFEPWFLERINGGSKIEKFFR